MKITSTCPLYIATEITQELIQLHQRLEARTSQLEAKADRLSSRSSASVAINRPGRKPKQLINPLAGHLINHCCNDSSNRFHGYPPWLDDVLQGIARLDWYRPNERSIPLSVKSLVRILDALPVISTNSISALLLVEERQARRYLKAIELALPCLLKTAPESLTEHKCAVNDEDGWTSETAPLLKTHYLKESFNAPS